MRPRLLLAALGLALAACAHAPAVQTICLPLKPYTAAEQLALAGALASLPETSPLVGAMADYGAMRAADRACLASR